MALTEVLRDVCARFPAVRAAFLFGSHARGTARPDSDVDVGLVVNADAWEASDTLAVVNAAGDAGIEWMDAVVLNDAPLVVQFEAVSPNRCIYSRDGFCVGSFVSRVVHMYWDFEPYLRLQREGMKRRLLDDDAA